MTFVFYFVSFVYATHNYSCEKVQWSLHSKEAIGLNGACHIIIGVLLVVISSLVVFIMFSTLVTRATESSWTSCSAVVN